MPTTKQELEGCQDAVNKRESLRVDDSMGKFGFSFRTDCNSFVWHKAS